MGTPSKRTRQRILKGIVAERASMGDIDMPMRVIEWRTWKPGTSYVRTDIGEVHVQYSTRGYQAVYGFDALGNVTIYMD